MEWLKVEGTQVEKPLELDTTSSPTTVYHRRNIERVEETEEQAAKWVYEEAQQSKEEYEKQQKELDSPLTKLLMQSINEVSAKTEMLQLQIELLGGGIDV